MAGALEAPMLDLTEPGGETLARRAAPGRRRSRIGSPRRSAPTSSAFLELHIEQGIVLESQSLDVGIVTSIVGIRRIEIVFEGAADHAGTTPMHLRQDALVAAANTVASVRRVAEQLAGEGEDYFVATVGILTVEPGASNVVPGRCRLVIDARTTDPALTARFVEAVERESAAHAGDGAGQAGAAHDAVRRQAGRLRPDCCAQRCARPRAISGLRETDLASGAGHDAAFMSRICTSAHGVRALPRGQEPRAGGMVGPRADRRRRRRRVAGGQGARPFAAQSRQKG